MKPAGQPDKSNDHDIEGGPADEPMFQPDDGDEEFLKTNVILHTSDGLDFYVHKLILSQASPFFRAMFNLPQPQELRGDGASTASKEPPSVDVQEVSETWNRILQLLYPVSDPTFTTLDQIKPVLEAARKYQLDAVTASMRRLLLQPCFVEKEPLRVYAIACCYQLELVARVAARFTLRDSAFGPCVDELDNIPASTYHRLLDYRMRCAQVAAEIPSLKKDRGGIGMAGVGVASINWLDHVGFVFFGGQHPCICAPTRNVICQVHMPDGSDRRLMPRTYWNEYMERAAAALEERPCGATVKDPSILAPAITVATRCELCRPKAYTDIVTFADAMAAAIEKAVDKVELTFKR